MRFVEIVSVLAALALALVLCWMAIKSTRRNNK
jgi:hypothetical protein